MRTIEEEYRTYQELDVVTKITKNQRECYRVFLGWEKERNTKKEEAG
jgi:hypothetical protein